MTSGMFSFVALLLLLLSSQNNAASVPGPEGVQDPLTKMPIKLSDTNKESKSSISQMVPNNNPSQKMDSPVNEPKVLTSSQEETRNIHNQSPSDMVSSYLTPTLSQSRIVTSPKRKLFSEFTYFTFDKNAKRPVYGLGSSKLIQQLNKNAPIFTVDTVNIIYHEETDSVAFIRRANNIRYGGRLAYLGGDFDSRNDKKDQRKDFIGDQALVSKLQRSALNILKKNAPVLLKLVQDAHIQPNFKGFASAPMRDLRYEITRQYPPTTSAVFLTTLNKVPKVIVTGAEDRNSQRLFWVPRKTLLSLATQYYSKVNYLTCVATDKDFDGMDFVVTDFAFDHLKLAEAVLTKTNSDSK